MNQSASKKGISFIVPALNEEKNLALSVESIENAMKEINNDYEIIIVDDGSQDDTARIAELIQESNPRVIFIQHSLNLGLGKAYFSGVLKAKFPYVLFVPGDNENGESAICPLLGSIGEVDIIVPFPSNNEERGFVRSAISKIFTRLVNLLSGLNLKYYNGSVIHSRNLLLTYPFKTSGFGYQAEILVHLIRLGASYKEIPIVLNIRRNSQHKTNAFKVKNILNVGLSLIKIFKIRLTVKSNDLN